MMCCDMYGAQKGTVLCRAVLCSVCVCVCVVSYYGCSGCSAMLCVFSCLVSSRAAWFFVTHDN